MSNPNTTSNVGSTSSTGSSGVKDAAQGLKGLAAAVHGAGEKVRGTFNEGVDEAFHEPTGVQKNAAVAQAGDKEIATGEFSHGTKTREGAVPGSTQ